MAAATELQETGDLGEVGSSDSKDNNAMLLDSFSPIGFPDIDQYKKMLPRRIKQRDRLNCCGLSSTSWVFLASALLQG